MGISAVPFDPELGGDLIGGPKADTADVAHDTVRILAHELDSVGAVGPEGSDGSRSPHAMHVEKELFASLGCAAENLALAAGAYGLVPEVSFELSLASADSQLEPVGQRVGRDRRRQRCITGRFCNNSGALGSPAIRRRTATSVSA